LPVALLSLSLGLTTAHAFDGTKSHDTNPEVPGVGPVGPQAPLGGDPTDMKAFFQKWQIGDTEGAVKALESAFRNGNLSAGWKLGRMHADGDGVPQDKRRAFEYFRSIAEHGEDVSGAASRFVAGAWVAMGQYYLTGIPNSDIKPDAVRALQYFTHAAVNLGDADAQYNLGRMYLDGQGVAKAPMQAARWFYQAAMKSHYEAQAEFGRLLFKGAPGVVPREGAKGLMWLHIATDNAPNGVTAPQDVYSSAWKQATEEERSAADVYYEQWKQRGHLGR
jgi:TPR repeat protein